MTRSQIHQWLQTVLGRSGYRWVQQGVRQAARLSPPYLLRRHRFRRWNRTASGSRLVLRPGLELELSPESHAAAEWFSFRSAPMVAEFDAFLAATQNRRRLLDVGAFHALFSLAFAQHPDKSALALEPSPVAFATLSANLRMNPACRIQAIEVAAGATDGLLRMEADWMHLRAVPAATPSVSAVEIPVRRIDEICATAGFEPDAIKIDVEGFEVDVLRGAQEVLRAYRPIVFLEVHPTLIVHMGRSMPALWALLREAGYGTTDARGRVLEQRAFEALDGFPRLICRPVDP